MMRCTALIDCLQNFQKLYVRRGPERERVLGLLTALTILLNQIQELFSYFHS